MERFVVVVQHSASAAEPFSSVFIRDNVYYLIYVCSGKEALDVAGTFKPDFFLIEHKNPVIEGMKLSYQLHTLPGQEDVPIVVALCGAVFPQKSSRINDRHVSYIDSPFQLEHLLQLTESMHMMSDL